MLKIKVKSSISATIMELKVKGKKSGNIFKEEYGGEVQKNNNIP